MVARVPGPAHRRGRRPRDGRVPERPRRTHFARSAGADSSVRGLRPAPRRRRQRRPQHQDLGGEPFPVGFVGNDATGRSLVALLKRKKIKTVGVGRAAGYGTPLKTRILGGGFHSTRQQIVRMDRTKPLSEASRRWSEGHVRRALSRVGRRRRCPGERLRSWPGQRGSPEACDRVRATAQGSTHRRFASRPPRARGRHRGDAERTRGRGSSRQSRSATT